MSCREVRTGQPLLALDGNSRPVSPAEIEHGKVSDLWADVYLQDYHRQTVRTEPPECHDGAGDGFVITVADWLVVLHIVVGSRPFQCCSTGPDNFRSIGWSGALHA